jgi:hypothetical protein
MLKLRLLAFSIFLSVAATACTPSEADLATFSAQTQEVKDANASEVAGTQAAIKSTKDTQSTSIARTATYEFNQIAAETQAYESKATSAAKKTATMEASNLAATAQASSMYDQVSDLVAQGYVSRIEGTYHTIEDFNETWAQIDWCQYWYPGYSQRILCCARTLPWIRLPITLILALDAPLFSAKTAPRTTICLG